MMSCNVLLSSGGLVGGDVGGGDVTSGSGAVTAADPVRLNLFNPCLSYKIYFLYFKLTF